MSKSSGKERYGFDPLQRVAFQRVGKAAQRKAIEEYHRLYGKPEDGQPYDYEELVRLGKFFDAIKR
jgi:hypothetical protein